MIGLASQSPRRRELLDQIGVSHTVIHIDVDETPMAGERPAAYVSRLALSKAETGWLAAQGQWPVLGSDTAVVLGDTILGKPTDAAQAATMLQQLSNRTHQVMTAVALVSDSLSEVRTQISEVTFRAMNEVEIQHYIASGEPLDKAGSYAIQGLAAVFVHHLSGSYSAVMGLPLYETAELLALAGIPTSELFSQHL